MERLIKIGDALSQLGNVAWLFWPHKNTTANESISGRAHRENRKTLKKLINSIFFWQEDHCKSAFDKDLQRAKDLLSQYKDE